MSAGKCRGSLGKAYHCLFLKHSFPNDILLQFAVAVHPQCQPHKQTCILGNQCSQGYAFHFHPEETDKAEACHDVDNVLRNGYVHGNAGVLHTDVPPGESV